MSKREPIPDAISGGGLTEDQIAKLRIVEEVRKFASDRLGLPNNKSYTLFADVARQYVGWNVYAAPRYSVDPHEWCFPFVGCVVYRGFFSKDQALSYAHGLEQGDQLDVFLKPINAYSTLGHFDDPILSSNLLLPEYRVAELVIHELAHQRLFFPGKSRINEAFATVVERAGLLLFLQESGRTDWINGVKAAWAIDDETTKLVLAARDELKAAYAGSGDPAPAKKQIFDKLRAAIRGGVCAGKIVQTEDDICNLNNAYIVAVDTYYGEYEAIATLLTGAGGDFNKFYTAVERKYR
jgi:predicted aminopeptidase